MNENIRDAAAESIRAEDPRQRLHDVTFEALKARRFDRDAIREVVRAVTEGMTRGAEGSRLGLRHALAEGFRGMDEALAKSVQAGEEVLRGLRRVEDDLLATVDEVAHSANERVRPELREVLREAAHAGTQTGRHSAKLMAEFALGGLELAGEIGARAAHLAGGVLAGMADALDKKRNGKTGA